jgi:hypothetical protein
MVVTCEEVEGDHKDEQCLGNRIFDRHPMKIGNPGDRETGMAEQP